MTDAQQWIENKYSPLIQKNTIRLDISNKNLEGSLDLSSFTKLEELKCSGNSLTTLILSKCLRLRKVEVDRNVRVVALEHIQEKLEEEKKKKKRKGRLLPATALVWIDIHPNFTLELTKIWQDLGFSREQAREWITVGFKPSEYETCVWLRDVAKKDAEWIKQNATCQEAKRRFENWQEKQKQIELEIQIERQTELEAQIKELLQSKY